MQTHHQAYLKKKAKNGRLGNVILNRTQKAGDKYYDYGNEQKESKMALWLLLLLLEFYYLIAKFLKN